MNLLEVASSTHAMIVFKDRFYIHNWVWLIEPCVFWYSHLFSRSSGKYYMMISNDFDENINFKRFLWKITINQWLNGIKHYFNDCVMQSYRTVYVIGLFLGWVMAIISTFQLFFPGTKLKRDIAHRQAYCILANLWILVSQVAFFFMISKLVNIVDVIHKLHTEIWDRTILIYDNDWAKIKTIWCTLIKQLKHCWTRS